MEPHHLFLGGLVQAVRDKFHIDWTIPATWIVSLVLAVIVNLIVSVWVIRGLYNNIENLQIAVIELKDHQQKIEALVAERIKFRDQEQRANEVELARQREVDSLLRAYLEKLEWRVTRLEETDRKGGKAK